MGKQLVVGVLILTLASGMNILPYVNSSQSNTNVILYANDAIHQFTEGQEVHLAGQITQYLSPQPSGIPNVPYRIIDADTNSIIQSGSTDSKGEFGFTWVVKTRDGNSGTINLEAIFDGYGKYRGSASNLLSLNIISTIPQILNPSSTPDYVVSVSTDKQFYTSGNKIIILGQVSQIIPVYPIILRIQSPNGNMITSQQLSILADKTFSTTINLGGNSWVDGTYTVFVQYTSKFHVAQTTFVFEKSTIIKPPNNITNQIQPENNQHNAVTNTETSTVNNTESNIGPNQPSLVSALPTDNQLLVIIIVIAAGSGIVGYLIKSRRFRYKSRIKQRSKTQFKNYEPQTSDEALNEHGRRNYKEQTKPDSQSPTKTINVAEEIKRRQREEQKRRQERNEKPIQSVTIGFDPYRIMGLGRNASCADIKTRFKELVKKNSLVGIINMSKEEKERKEKILSDIILAKDMIEKEKGCTN
jgi:hypothetical protein